MRSVRSVRVLAGLLAGIAIVSCSSTAKVVPATGAMINTTLQVSPTIAVPLEAVLGAAAAGALLYVIYDPLAPNWSIEEKPLADDTYYLSLRAKSFRTGGDGEAIQIIKRRALQLQREKGYAGYQLLDYSEGIESSTPLTRRVSEGTIQLVRAPLAPPR